MAEDTGISKAVDYEAIHSCKFVFSSTQTPLPVNSKIVPHFPSQSDKTKYNKLGINILNSIIEVTQLRRNKAIFKAVCSKESYVSLNKFFSNNKNSLGKILSLHINYTINQLGIITALDFYGSIKINLSPTILVYSFKIALDEQSMPGEWKIIEILFC